MTELKAIFDFINIFFKISEYFKSKTTNPMALDALDTTEVIEVMENFINKKDHLKKSETRLNNGFLFSN